MAEEKAAHYLLSPASHNRFAHAALRDLSIITKSIILRPPLSRGPIRVCRLNFIRLHFPNKSEADIVDLFA